MTFDERLDEIVERIFDKGARAMYGNDPSDWNKADDITAIKQAMREALPEKKKLSTDYLTQDDSISKSHKREVAYYNTAIDEIEKGFGL